MAYELRLLWHTNPPPFMPYEPFLLGVGVVFNLLIWVLEKHLFYSVFWRSLPNLGGEICTPQIWGVWVPGDCEPLSSHEGQNPPKRKAPTLPSHKTLFFWAERMEGTSPKVFPPPRKTLQTRDLELLFLEGSRPSCWPHFVRYTHPFLQPYCHGQALMK